MYKIFRRSRSRGSKLRGGVIWLIFDLFIFDLSLKGELRKGSMISGGWTEKSTVESGATRGGSGAVTKGICASSGKRSNTEKEDREARK